MDCSSLSPGLQCNDSVLDSSTEHVQERDSEETLKLKSLSLGSKTHADEGESFVITSIRAINLALGPKQSHAGFYAAVYHSELEWRTENKPALANSSDIEWSGPIPVPSDLSASISLAVYAPFELQPMLGNGERLGTLTVTVEQLLDHSAREIEFIFQGDEHDKLPCLSLLVTIERRANDSGVLTPRLSTIDLQGLLDDMTDQGRNDLLQYQKRGEERDLELAIQQFRDVLDVCPEDYPCYAAAQSNLAMAMFLCRPDSESDAPFEVPIALYRNALARRPVGHLDRARTLVALAAVLLARFEKRKDTIDVADARALLREAVDLGSAESDEYQTAVSVLQSHDAFTTTGAVRIGAFLLGRFERYNDLAALQQAIPLLETSLKFNSSGDHHYIAGLSMLSVAFSYRFHRLGQPSDLEEAILIQRDIVERTLDDNPQKPCYLNNLGNSLVIRFERLKRPSDLAEALLRQQNAIRLVSDVHPDKPDYLNSLGCVFQTRFLHSRQPSDLEEAIQKQQDAVRHTSDSHPNKPTYLNNLRRSFTTRFLCLGQLRDLEEAILKARDAVRLTPDGHSEKPNRLVNLGLSLRFRFERLGVLNDLEEAISSQRDAVHLTPDDAPHKPGFLQALNDSLLSRFRRLGQPSDLNEAISRQRDVVRLTPNSHPQKSTHISNLSHALITCFMRFGELNNLEEAISRQRDAVHLTPDDHPDKPRYLNILANYLITHFERSTALNDLDEAISMYQCAFYLISDGHPNGRGLLNNLGVSFRRRFEHVGDPSDLERAISNQEKVIALTPDADPSKPDFMVNLCLSLTTRFDCLGRSSDLEDAISMQQDAIRLTPDGHSNKPGFLSGLGNSYKTRFLHFGDLNDLEKAIARQQDALNLTPDDHLEKFILLNNLVSSLCTRFSRLGELSDLEEAILRQRDVVRLTPGNHFEKPRFLGNLGTLLALRFDRLGKLGDLEEAIRTQRNAIDLMPDGQPERRSYLTYLAASFFFRFDRVGEPGDLEEAISRQRDAVGLTPDTHPQKPSFLNSLGTFFRARFQHFGKLEDLEEAISRQKNAIDLSRDGHPDRHAILDNLGVSFSTRFDCLGELGDLEEAIQRQRDAVALTPDDHPVKPVRLNHLSTSLSTRFFHLEERSDLEEAISMQRDIADLTPDGHPHKPSYLRHLGDLLSERFKRLGDPNDIEQAALSYSLAACAPTGPIAVRFHASRQWILCCHSLGHHQTLLDASSIAIRLLPQLAWIGLSLSHRYHELIRAADVVREAAAVALDLGQPETAVEWLEQGRSIVWAGMLQLRGSHDELSSSYPDHATKLHDLSAALEHVSSDREKIVFLPLEQASDAEHRQGSLKRVADDHRALAIERDELLEDIRKLPGFERFLLHKEFSQLRAAAHAGPVVILNVAATRCDALIVLADVDHVIHVPLSKFTLQRSIDLRISLGNITRHAPVVLGDRDGEPVPQVSRSRLEPILASLWKCVVKPVLDALALSIPGELQRIFWCPTGPLTFLPIHAAGFYDSHHSQLGHKVFDFVVSSYIPSLSVLLSPRDVNAVSTTKFRLLAVRQPLSDGRCPLPGVATELEHIKTAIKNAPFSHIILDESSTGTVVEVLAAMKNADFVHFACHGVQDSKNPIASGLCLADERRLKLSDVISLRPHGGLAFLSACQTAKGDESLSDEAVHIAAGMLYAGYGGVIGTMWIISDRHAPAVAKDFYEQLFSNGSRPDYRDAARALHIAVGRLRDNNVPFDDWLPFIHMGL